MFSSAVILSRCSRAHTHTLKIAPNSQIALSAVLAGFMDAIGPNDWKRWSFLFCFLFFSACNDLKLCSRRVYFPRLLVCKIKSDCSIDAMRCEKKKNPKTSQHCRRFGKRGAKRFVTTESLNTKNGESSSAVRVLFQDKTATKAKTRF